MERRTFLHRSLLSVLALFGFGQTKAWANPKTAAGITGAVTRIAFGSCAVQDKPQPIWNSILKARPDLFLFIGDNIYADTEDMTAMSQKYDLLGVKPEYAEFRSKVPIVATWDDHDFGINDGGAEYPKKHESKKLMLDFFNEPKESERRTRDGVYTSYMLGPDGKKVQFILMDLRWFRTALIKDKGSDAYVPNPDPAATILGAAQWQWLEKELKKPADVRIIASSTQFSPPDHPWEKWANFPLEKKRMIDLIDKLKIRNAVFISGDMHYGELSMEKTPGGFDLYDLTSSGMNIVEPGVQYKNTNRLEIWDKSPNFGFIEINWSAPVSVSLQVRDIDGATKIERQVKLV